jgi:multidrug efflux system membrane fusion protein
MTWPPGDHAGQWGIMAAPLRLALIVSGLVWPPLASSMLASRLFNGAAKRRACRPRGRRRRAAPPRRLSLLQRPPSRADVPIRLTALGSVTAFNTVTVRPRVDGQLVSVLFREGQFVKRGSAAQIDPRRFRCNSNSGGAALAGPARWRMRVST